VAERREPGATAAVLRALRTQGVVLFRGAPRGEHATAASGRSPVAALGEALGGYVRPTHHGETFIVKSVPAPASLAYTPRALAPHADLGYRSCPPGVQLLHARVVEAEGGANTLVDGLAVAERLTDTSWEVLTTVRVTQAFTTMNVHHRCSAPVLQVDDDGAVVCVRHNERYRRPISLPSTSRFSERDVYAALREFDALVNDSRMQAEVRLEEGDVLVFVNRRLLHGRRAIGAGRRVLEGCYLEMDEVESHMRMAGVAA